MTALAAWVVLPLVLSLASLGCGLLIELVAGIRLPPALLLPLGFALLVVAAEFPPLARQTASLAAPLVVALALVGLVLSARRLWALREPWAAAAALGAFGAYAAPVALSGRATFAGYIKLDDTATYLAMLDRIETHGRSLAGLPPSTFEATLATSLDYGYPLGSFAPLGVGEQLLGVDPAWLWQPYLATLGALLALALYALISPLVESRPLRAVIAFVAAQPALLYGYSLWGGIKELAVAVLLATLCASIPVAVRANTPRGVVPLAVTSAAIVGVLSVGGAVWLAALLPALVLVRQRRGTAFAGRAAGAFVATGAILALPAIVAAVEWLGHAGAFTGERELGNLIGPLKLAQIAGIWPVGDFRTSPGDGLRTYVLVAVVVAAAAGGAAWATTRRAWENVIYLGGAVTGALVLYFFGSPWIAAKSLATAAPALLLLALVGVGALAATRRRVEATVVGVAIIGGVAWSNALAYREVWLAPRDRLAELESIGSRYAGQGPALMTEFEPYGVRHFLRRLDPEGTSELRRHVVPLRSGQPLAPQAYADIDRFRLPELLAYRLLVLRRSPSASRPPSAYRLVERRRWYEVWRRADSMPILAHLPLGTDADPSAVPPCGVVLQLGKATGVSRLVAVERAPVIPVPFSPDQVPPGWSARPGGMVEGSTAAAFAGTVNTPAGDYGIWVGGSFVGRLSAKIDGRPAGRAHHELEWPGQFVELGSVQLAAGAHRFRLEYAVGGWRPGSYGLAPFPLGPIMLAPTAEPALVTVAPSRARALCGRRLDWVEAVG